MTRANQVLLLLLFAALALSQVPKKTTDADSSGSTKNKPKDAVRVSAAVESREERSSMGRPIRSLLGHQDRVTSVAYSSNGRWIGTACWDGTARLWDAETGEEVRRWDVTSPRDVRPAHLTQIMFSHDNESIVAASLYGVWRIVIVWNRRTGEQVRAFQEGCAALSPDGKMIACSGRFGGGGVIRLHDFATGKMVREMLGLQDAIRWLIFSPDGKTLLSIGSLAPIPRDDSYIGAMPPEVLRVWDVATEKERRSEFVGLRAGPRTVSFSPDGRALAAIGRGTITLRETATGERRSELTGHTKGLNEVAFSPDGRTLASASDDGTVRLWGLLSGKEVGRLEGHPRWVLAVAFSPDGRTLVSGGLDKEVHIWDVSRITGRPDELKERSATELDADWRELHGDAARLAKRASVAP